MDSCRYVPKVESTDPQYVNSLLHVYIYSNYAKIIYKNTLLTRIDFGDIHLHRLRNIRRGCRSIARLDRFRMETMSKINDMIDKEIDRIYQEGKCETKERFDIPVYKSC